MGKTLLKNKESFLQRMRQAIVSGDSKMALKATESFAKLLAREGITPEERPILEASLAELRALAQASERGAQRAMEQIGAIIQAARSLQTYDESGRKTVTDTGETRPRRY